MLHTSETYFYIKLIPICWFKKNYLQLELNMIAANEPFISSQVEYIAETNIIANNIILQICDNLNNND